MIRYALIPLAVLAAPAAAQDLTPAEIAKIDSAVADGLKATGVPSASVSVVRGGKLVFAKAYGSQAPGWTSARATAPYQIASVSKQFTAAALLLLQRDGKLSLDDKVSKYLPEISGADRITLRQLLSHTSGLQDYWPQDYSFAAMEKPVTPQAIVDRWAKKPLDFDPGTQWQYSNTGYVVAGMIAEKVGGAPLFEQLQRRVFKPLGITAYDQDKAVGGAFPAGYHRFALGPVRLAKPAAYGWLFAAGELAMSPSDLAKWNIARLNRTLLTPAEWAEQEQVVKLSNGGDTRYGLGVFVLGGADGARRMIEHSGEAVGFLTENIVYPDEKAAITVAVNADFGDAQGTIALKIAEVILPPKPEPEAAKTAQARAIFDAMRAGTLDPKLMTENWNYFYTADVAGDYRASLTPLGAPSAFELLRAPRLRGGFVNRNYRITYPNGQKLIAITYAEPGDTGRYEQFLIYPAQ
ncbi:MAG: serine hydrolase [Proteobacteria bacterium SG_bin5]|nr:beta-lactamase family protein [Sphingomonas sp.]OQW39424.1 MAG: serine hydrolase [Proteobacteria bacterium SG_bin5]